VGRDLCGMNASRNGTASAYRNYAEGRAPVFLDDFVHAVSELPSEVKRQLTRIRELDEKATRVQESLETQASQRVGRYRSKGKPSEGVRAVEEDAAVATAECDEIAKEKLLHVARLQDLVQRAVQLMNDQLIGFEEYLKKEDKWPAGAQSAVNEPSHRPARQTARAAMVGLGGLPGVDGQATETSVGESPAAEPSYDVPIDPSEPTYCYCNQVSYGEMVACENPDCPYEWFHFQCVGLTAEPKGVWRCPDCRRARR